jgi:hypothetical protein
MRREKTNITAFHRMSDTLHELSAFLYDIDPGTIMTCTVYCQRQ